MTETSKTNSATRLRPAPRVGRTLIARLRREARRRGLHGFEDAGLVTRKEIEIAQMIVRRYDPTDALYHDGDPGRQLNQLHLALRTPVETYDGQNQFGVRTGAKGTAPQRRRDRTSSQGFRVSVLVDDLDDQLFDDEMEDDSGSLIQLSGEPASPGEIEEQHSAAPLPTGSFSDLSDDEYRQARRRLVGWMQKLAPEPLPSEVALCLMLAAGLEQLPQHQLRSLMLAQDSWMLMASPYPGVGQIVRGLVDRNVLVNGARIEPRHHLSPGGTGERMPISVHVTREIMHSLPRVVPLRGDVGDGLHLVVSSRPDQLPVELAGILDHVIEMPPLTLSLLAHVIAEATPHPVKAVYKGLRRAVMRQGFSPEHLKLADLDYAIRSRRSVGEIITTLHVLALDRESEKTASLNVSGGTVALHRFLALRQKTASGKAERSATVDRKPPARSDKDATASMIFLPNHLLAPDANGSMSANRYGLSDVQLREAMSAGPRGIEDLPGLGEAGIWAGDLKRDVAAWRRGDLTWTDVSSRLLLSGPPGCGKTSFAKALANSVDLPVFASSVSTWLEKGYLGDVLKQIVKVFNEATAAAPAILFIDEIDGLGTRQDQTKPWAGYSNAIINRCLELLDGIIAQTGLIVIGATNLPQLLDPALVRSGRLDRHVQIPMPDHDSLRGIVRHYLGDDLDAVAQSLENADRAEGPLTARLAGPPVDRLLDRIALLAAGRTGADVERIVREARSEARRSEKPLDYAAIERQFLGGNQQVSDDIRWHFAVHEAGHAVVIERLGIATLTGLSMSDASGGSTSYEFTRIERRADQLDFLTVLLAGREAEKLVIGEPVAGSGGSHVTDLARATEIAVGFETRFGFGETHPLLYRENHRHHALIETDPDLAARVSRRLEEAAERAAKVLAGERDAVIVLAEALQRDRVLSGGRAREIIAAARPQSLAG